jgi:hypothetical protein
MSNTPSTTQANSPDDEIQIIWMGNAWLPETAELRTRLGPAVHAAYGNDSDDIVICVGCPSNCSSIYCPTDMGCPANQPAAARPARKKSEPEK